MTTQDRVRELRESGLNPSEIARTLGVARPTVEYHLRRLSSPGNTRGPAPVPVGVRSEVRTSELVTRLLERGLTRAAIARELGITKATVSYHARRAGARIDARCAR